MEVESPWDVLWDAGRNILVLYTAQYGLLWGDTKIGGRRVRMGEGTTVGKTKRQRDKVDWLPVSRFLDSMFFWPCPTLIKVVCPVSSLYSFLIFLG